MTILLSNVSEESGVLGSDARYSTSDGRVVLRLDAGAEALTATGEPLRSIWVYAPHNIPESRDGCRLVGPAFAFGPDGALFSPHLEITLQYDSASCPQGVDEEDLVIARFDAATEEWTGLPSVVDTVHDRISAQVSGFSLFAVVAEVSHAMSWWLVVGILSGAIGVVLGARLLIRRRDNRPAAEVVAVESEEPR
jgi:hypothetical protein